MISIKNLRISLIDDMCERMQHMPLVASTLRNGLMGVIFVIFLWGCTTLAPPSGTSPSYAASVHSSPPPASISHTVKTGDTLGSIAKVYTGNTMNYKRIAVYNEISNPNAITPGMHIRIPPELLLPAYRPAPPIPVASPRGAPPPPVTTDSTRTKFEASGLGALLGGVAGALLCGDNRAKCALIGSAIGGSIGYLAGNAVAERKQHYATNEQYLESEIANAKQLNAELAKYNRNLEVRRMQLDAEVRKTRTAYNARMLSAEHLEKKHMEIQEIIKNNNTIRDSMQRELAIKSDAYNEQLTLAGASNPQALQLHKQISILKDNIEKLDLETKQLAKINDRLSI